MMSATVRLDDSRVRRVDDIRNAVAKELGIKPSSRSEAVRMLLDVAFEARTGRSAARRKMRTRNLVKRMIKAACEPQAD